MTRYSRTNCFNLQYCTF